MRLCRTWLAVGLLPILAVSSVSWAATVYRWVDADGVVHFSDQPAPGAEKINTTGGSSHGILGQPPPPQSPQSPQDPPRAPTAEFAGVTVAITSPAPGQVFSGAEAISAYLSIQPEPSNPVTVTWGLNGSPVGDGQGSQSLTLPQLPRGSYTLTAKITDPDTGQSKSAEPVTFNVLRPSLLSPQHK